MSNIKSKYEGKVTSETKATTITREKKSDITSKTEMHIDSNIDAATERVAFLTTAKRNAAIMFSKDL